MPCRASSSASATRSPSAAIRSTRTASGAKSVDGGQAPGLACIGSPERNSRSGMCLDVARTVVIKSTPLRDGSRRGGRGRPRAGDRGHMASVTSLYSVHDPPGNLVGVVGIAVGFGSNFLNAVYAERRLILNNGSHRAFALRRMGFTHVPCIVQHLSTRDELDVLAASAIRRHPDFFLKGPRPSMLKDYFNPKLHKVVPVRRQLKQITIKFQIEEAYVPAL